MENRREEPTRLRILLVTTLLKTVIRVIARVNSRELRKIPREGPLIICINHINFLEVPLIQTWLMPRKMRGFVKRETWENPFMAFLLDTYRAIPVDRGGINMNAFREVRNHLEAGNFITLAPEGTRSGDGVLQEGKPGIVAMALMAGSPILPVIHFGGEKFWENFKKFRRTKVEWRVGRPFRLDSNGKTDATVREEMTREVMFQMAALMPEELRGSYADSDRQTEKYLKFVEL